MTQSQFTRTTLCTFALFAGAALCGTSVPDARAQSDFTHVLNFPYTPSNCSAEPAYDRVFRLQRVAWKGHEYLFVDEGNDIRIFNIDDPLSPAMGYSSYFGIPPFGDVDYNLVNFSVCDDCRWGVGNHRSGTILFDLGTDATPSIGSDSFYSDTVIEGGFTFSHGGQQYLVAADLGTNPCPWNNSGLYEFNSLDEAQNPLVHCLDNGGTGPQIANGLVVPDTPTPTLYLAERFGNFRIYSMQTAPTFSLQYEGTGGIERSRMDRAYGAAVDTNAGLLAVANGGTLSLYDIGWASGTPKGPMLLQSQDLGDQPNANVVGLRYPIVWVAQRHSTLTALTFDVSNPTAWVPLDQSFWDASHAWNSLSTCLWGEMAVFSGNGTAMYLSRYADLQVIDVSGIQPPPPPCGNAVVDVLEDCDDGNTTDGDGCSVTCTVESGWTCSGEPSVCASLTSCGDGLLQSPESCDDGNTTDGDGCSAACQPESGWACSGEPSVCVPTTPCGDGHIDPGEGCDDGNQAAADGCSNLCQVESGWTCEGQPSFCTEQNPTSSGTSGGCGCVQHRGGLSAISGVVWLWLALWFLWGVRRRSAF
jgi:cysteine-rich repeat protein